MEACDNGETLTVFLVRNYLRISRDDDDGQEVSGSYGSYILNKRQAEQIHDLAAELLPPTPKLD